MQLSKKIDIIEYRYEIGDLVKFRLHDGNTKTHNVVVGVVVKKSFFEHVWHEEAEFKANASKLEDALIYEVVCEGNSYSITQSEIIMLMSSNFD